MLSKDILPTNVTYDLSTSPLVTNNIYYMESLHDTLYVAISQLFRKLGILGANKVITLDDIDKEDENVKITELEVVLPNFTKTGNFQNWLRFEYNVRLIPIGDELIDMGSLPFFIYLTFDRNFNMVLSLDNDHDLQLPKGIQSFIEIDEHFDPWYDPDEENVPSIVLKDYSIITEKSPTSVVLNIRHIIGTLIKLSIIGRSTSRNTQITNYYNSDENHRLFNSVLTEGSFPTERNLMGSFNKVKNELEKRETC